MADAGTRGEPIVMHRAASFAHADVDQAVGELTAALDAFGMSLPAQSNSGATLIVGCVESVIAADAVDTSEGAA